MPPPWLRLTEQEQAALLALPDAIVERLAIHWLTHGPTGGIPMPQSLADKLGRDVATTIKNGLHAWLRNADDFEGP